MLRKRKLCSLSALLIRRVDYIREHKSSVIREAIYPPMMMMILTLRILATLYFFALFLLRVRESRCGNTLAHRLFFVKLRRGREVFVQKFNSDFPPREYKSEIS